MDLFPDLLPNLISASFSPKASTALVFFLAPNILFFHDNSK